MVVVCRAPKDAPMDGGGGVPWYKVVYYSSVINMLPPNISICMCVFAKIRPKNVTNFFVEKWEKSYTKLASRKCDHNKSVHPCARAVAKVVRMPRSEVSERHRAGSWVWVVAKSRLEIWESLNCPPTKWGYWPASHENPGTGENGVSPRASNCCCCC